MICCTGECIEIIHRPTIEQPRLNAYRFHVGHIKKHRGIVAVVEDDHSVNHSMCRLLSAAGFEARAFDSGEALLMDERVREHRCLIVDAELPGISGFELYRKLQLNGVRVPLVVVTAHDDSEHRDEASKLGATAYFSKPFSSAAFIDAVIEASGESQDR